MIKKDCAMCIDEFDWLGGLNLGLLIDLSTCPLWLHFFKTFLRNFSDFSFI